MQRQWEHYKGKPNEPFSERMHVSLNPRCIFLLNKNVLAAMDYPDFAVLMYDRRNQTIGIRPAGQGDKDPFSVKQHPKGSHRGIYAKPFCRHYGIVPTEHIRFTAPEVDRDGTLVLSLHLTEPVEKKKRSKRVVGTAGG